MYLSCAFIVVCIKYIEVKPSNILSNSFLIGFDKVYIVSTYGPGQLTNNKHPLLTYNDRPFSSGQRVPKHTINTINSCVKLQRVLRAVDSKRFLVSCFRLVRKYFSGVLKSLKDQETLWLCPVNHH